MAGISPDHRNVQGINTTVVMTDAGSERACLSGPGRDAPHTYRDGRNKNKCFIWQLASVAHVWKPPQPRMHTNSTIGSSNLLQPNPKCIIIVYIADRIKFAYPFLHGLLIIAIMAMEVAVEWK